VVFQPVFGPEARERYAILVVDGCQAAFLAVHGFYFAVFVLDALAVSLVTPDICFCDFTTVRTGELSVSLFVQL